MRPRASLVTRHPAVVAVSVCAAAYAASLAVLAREPGTAVGEPLFLLLVLGVAFPLLAWALTGTRRRVVAAPAPAATAPRAGVLPYLAAFAVLVLGWGFSSVQAAFPAEPAQSVVQLVVKLVTMVLLPGWLFLRLRLGSRARLPPARLFAVFAVMGVAYLALQVVFGRGLTTLAAVSPSVLTLAWALPACLAWQTLEAGLCEEVLFRRIVQERLAATLRSPVAAVAWTSLLFGLAHAPGLLLRGGHAMEGVAQASPAWALAYSIVMIAPAGIAFGVLWVRTRSLWLLVPLHGLVDLLPQLAPFIRAWSGA